MKIGLLTIHNVNNYGAALQLYATVKTLEKYGNVDILNYTPSFIKDNMKLVRFDFTLKGPLRSVKDLIRLYSRIKCIPKFEKFYQEDMTLSPNLEADSDFVRVNDKYDMFVSGSDQIWNPFIVSATCELDSRYFLDFVVNKPKIAFSSSLGSYKYDEPQSKEVIKYLSSFSAISVREKDGAEYIGRLTQKKVTNTLDPTLLMSREQWVNSFEVKLTGSIEPYVLIYVIKKDFLVKNVVKKVSKALGIKVIAVDQDPFLNFSVDEHVKDAGPKEFVELFSKAKFVITNSFHGCCFSVNFNIPFVVIKPQSSVNRVASLLKMVGLENRLILGVDQDLDGVVQHKINYDLVNTVIDEKRNKTKLFIDTEFQKYELLKVVD